jgi:RNA polymerase sigma-70 factor (ECF subfamily)
MDLVRISKRKIVMVHEECEDFEDDINLYAIFEEEIDLKSLKAALGRLNLEEKALIYLKYLDDRSIRDIARMLQMTESAVKMRLMRSKQKLRKRYHEIFHIG